MLKPHDFILTRDNFLFAVKNYEEFDGHITASPKYIPYKIAKTEFMGHVWTMLGDRWSRINNPLDPKSKIDPAYRALFSDYEPAENQNEFRVGKDQILREFRCSEGIQRLLQEENSLSNVRQITQNLASLVTKHLPSGTLGLTGSSLFAGEIDNFSDIDLVVYGSKNYCELTDILRKQTSLATHFRTVKEWEKFYDHYGVNCSIGKREFAKHMANKADQILVEGIPVSIFAVRNNEDFKNLRAFDKDAFKSTTPITISGKIVDDSEAMFIPSMYLVETEGNKIFGVHSDNRAFLCQAKKGERVNVSGTLLANNQPGNFDWITLGNRGYITSDETSVFPYIVARNIAFSQPFLNPQDTQERVIVSERGLDLYTLFDPKNNLLYELNSPGHRIFKDHLEGLTVEEIHKQFIAQNIRVEKSHILDFINVLKLNQVIK